MVPIQTITSKVHSDDLPRRGSFPVTVTLRSLDLNPAGMFFQN
jgi:hypothetical protein